MDRRSLIDGDGDGTPTTENRNVFDDEFEAEDHGMVTDGFYGHDREGSGRQDHEPVRTAAAHVASSSSMTMTSAGPSRSWTRKSRGQQNPFASPEDADTEPPLATTPSGNVDYARRSISSASSHQFARTSSPRFGSGPSHPYGMYTQGTAVRTPSIATTSTIRPQMQSSSRGPQHPYALYTQGVDDDLDDESEHEAVQNSIPVGFLGIGEHYQRRRGPDGEEQDLLGDFGHTEQLPPYSRYPEHGPEKMPLLDVPNPPTALHSRAPVLGTDPGMDLMHTQLRPVPTQQSMTDQSELNRAPSIASRRSMAPSAQPSFQDETSNTQRSWSEKSWREKRKTPFCGVPCWWFIVLTAVLVFVAAMLGGVIGGFVQGQKTGQANAIAQAEKTLYDASAIVTSTTSAPPAVGTFDLPLGNPEATQNGCLPVAGQEAAWGCDLVGNTEVQIVIDTPPGSNQPGAYLTVDVDEELLPAYGSWRSQMSTLFSPFLLVVDNDARSNGAAYYFQAQYNKLVLVPEDAFSPPSGSKKRDFATLPSSWFNRKQFAGPMEKPWLCYWNNTFVEGFIYPKERAVPASAMTTSYPSPPSTGSPAYTTTMPWSITSARPGDTVTTTITMPSTTCIYTGAASAFPAWMANNYPGCYQQDGTAYPSSATGHSKRYEGPTGHSGTEEKYDQNNPGQYPFLVKIEERRLPGSPRPYCNQIQVLYDYNWGWAIDANGDQITIQLTEQDPDYHAYVQDGEAEPLRRHRLRRSETVPGECHCQWMSGQ